MSDEGPTPEDDCTDPRCAERFSRMAAALISAKASTHRTLTQLRGEVEARHASTDPAPEDTALHSIKGYRAACLDALALIDARIRGVGG